MKTMLDVVGAVKDYVDAHAGGGGSSSKIISTRATPVIPNDTWIWNRRGDVQTYNYPSYGTSVWTDGINIYYNENSTTTYIFNKSTKKSVEIFCDNETGLSDFTSFS